MNTATRFFSTLAACMLALAVSAPTIIFAQTKGETMRADADNSTSTIVYIGTYTGKGSKGIYKFRLNHDDARLTSQGLAAEIDNPSFLALSPNHRFLYCINEISDFHGQKSGAATSFAIDLETHNLTQLDNTPSGGVGPCYVSVTDDGNAVLVANYGSGSVALLPATDDDGGLGDPVSVAQHEGKSIVPKRQDGPHAHCIRPDPTGRYALAVDLGLDEIIAYRLAAESTQMDTSAPVVNHTDPGAGPRHIAFHPNGKFAYSSNELNSTLTAWTWSAEDGRLTKIESVSTVPADFKGTNYPAEVLVSPDGRYVYLSNRGDNSVAVFKVDVASGKLSTVGYAPTRGDHPRGMSLHPSGKFLIVANQDSDSLVVYKINADTGMPEFASEYDGISKPTGIVFL